nr:hypothetical protein [Tanacetum cinerariifolium]
MLKLHEETLPKKDANPALHAIRTGRVQKNQKNKSPHQVERAKDLLGLIHTDVCGPFKIVSRQGASYFVTFTDDFSRYGYVYLLKHKHEVFETFKVLQMEVENQLGKTIKSLRSDRGVFQKEVENQLGKTRKSLCYDREGQYMSKEFLDHLKDHGIITHRTPPYTPQHNGVSERRNRTLLDMVEKTPYEVWHGKAPKLSYLKVWGCEALVKRDTLTKPDKLKPRSIKCIFVGYPKETIGYSFYYPPENKVIVARNAEFLENSLIDQEASGSLEDLEIIQEEDTHPSLDTSQNHKEDDLEIDEPQSDIVPIRRSTRTRHAPDQLQSMKDNEVWVLVELPPNGKTDGSKWLFKKKTDIDGHVHIYKARLVAKGYTQTPGIDYEETFSPAADIRAIRILIAIATYYDYEIWQMDVKTMFLNGYLNEEVYMEQPEGFVNPKYPNRGLRASRELKPGALSLYVGNGQREAIEAIGAFYLCLPSRLEIVLNNCHYAPSITRGVISVSRYPKEMMRYSFYYPPENKVLVARNAEFLENNTSLNHEEDDLEIDEPQSDIIPIRRSTRTRHAPDRMCLYIDAEEHELGDLGEPANYKAALLDTYKWLFKKKADMDGNVHIYKARLMAKGYTQTPRIDYEETFSPVADIRAIRILIAIATPSEKKYLLLEMLRDLDEPANYKAALLDPESKKWLDAMNVEMQSMKDNDVWVLVEPPPNARTVGSKSKRLIGLCQKTYIEKILKRFYMENSKRETIPMQEKLKLSKSQGASTPAEIQRMQNIPYASAVGSIMYAVRCTRPDVAFAQNMTSLGDQVIKNDCHWHEAVRSFKSKSYVMPLVLKMIPGVGSTSVSAE